MGKWNEQAAPNNNLRPPGNSVKDERNHEFSEELSDGGERNEVIKQLQNEKKLT